MTLVDVATPRGTDERAVRALMREQIARLERRLADAGPSPRAPMTHGPCILGLGDLERVRDDLAARVAERERADAARADAIAERRAPADADAHRPRRPPRRRGHRRGHRRARVPTLAGLPGARAGRAAGRVVARTRVVRVSLTGRNAP